MRETARGGTAHDRRRLNMGQLTDARTAEAAGKPATGERAAILRKLSDACLEAIKIIELARSGIRDGDSYWHGSDVIGHMACELADLCSQLVRPSDEEMGVGA
jgi:hypothetical protein